MSAREVAQGVGRLVFYANRNRPERAARSGRARPDGRVPGMLAALMLCRRRWRSGQPRRGAAALEARAARLDVAGLAAPIIRGLVWPSEQTARRPYSASG